MTIQTTEQPSASRLQYFPITFFTVTLGLSGLAIAYEKAAEVLGFYPQVGRSLAYLALLIFSLISLIYLAKLIKYSAQVKEEFFHPLRVSFFAAMSNSLLLLAIAFAPLSYNISITLWYVGAILHLVLTFHTISFWINHSFEIHHSNPAWFIPIVGNLMVPIVGINYVHHDLLMFYFAIGIFFWIALFTIIFYRIIFHTPLVEKLIPTLFIMIAPPAIGYLAYYKLTGESYDFAAQMLYNIAIFFTLLLLFMVKKFIYLKFYLSWWAFIFPMSAITIATIIRYQFSQQIFFHSLSYLLLAITTILVIIVAYQTINSMRRGEICIQEK